MNDKHQEYFDMCIAYLEIGSVSAKQKINTGCYQNAVAYQLYHAIELFIKYAILKNKGNVNNVHDLNALFIEYNSIYSDDVYNIDHPFDFSSYNVCDLNVGEKEMHERHTDIFKPKYMDQHLRYPSNHRTGGYTFSIDSNYFSSMKEKFYEIHRKLNC
jgi:hypothetical protein